MPYHRQKEPIYLTPDSIMQQAGLPMPYDLASNQLLPCLYISPVANVLPLILCFVSSNNHPTIPHSFTKEQRLGSASADTQRDRGQGTAAGSTSDDRCHIPV